MIWGITKEQKVQYKLKKSEEKKLRDSEPKFVFALWPIRLTDGRMAWLEYVMTYIYHEEKSYHFGGYWKTRRYQEIVKPPRPPRRAGDP